MAGRSSAAAEEPPARTGEERFNRSFEVGDNGYLAEEAPLPVHLWVVGADSGAPRRITSAAGSVATDGLSWSADGTRIAVARLPSAHSGAGIRASLVVVDVASGSERNADAGPASVAAPAISPDGRWLAYARPAGAEPGFTPLALFVSPLAGGERRNATAKLDRSRSGWEWLPASDGWIFAAPDGTHNALWTQPLDGAARRLELGSVEATGSLAIGPKGTIVFVGSEPTRTSELYVIAAPGELPKRLTTFNDSLGTLKFGRVEGIDWKGPDGFDEDGVLVYPPDFAPGKTSGRATGSAALHG